MRTGQADPGQTSIQTAGLYRVNFQFDTNQVPAKDIVIDRVYIAPVAEPGSWAMLIAGLGLVGAGMRRRSRQQATVSA